MTREAAVRAGRRRSPGRSGVNGGEIVLEGLAQGGHGTAASAVPGLVLAQSDAAENLPARGGAPGRR